MKDLLEKLIKPKNREEYHQAFIELYSKEPYKSKLIQDFGEVYYLKVMEIYRERLYKKDFMIGPQSVADWQEMKKSLK